VVLKYILTSAAIFAAFFGVAQNAFLESDTNRLDLGKQTFLTISLEYSIDSDHRVVWPTYNDTLTAAIEILKVLPADTSLADNGNDHIFKISQRLLITCFDTGLVVIPPVKIGFNDSIVETNPLLITMISPQVDEKDNLRDIADIREVNLNFIDWLKKNWIWVALGLAIVGVIYFFYRHVRITEMEPSAPAPPKKEIIPAHIAALEALKKLKEKEKWQRGLLKEYHTDLSDIVRTYIEERFNLMAHERTSKEIINDLKRYGISSDALNVLSASLQVADMAKFAKYKPLPEENENAWLQISAFIEKTAEVTQS
jgi:hypothetical protein